MHCIYHRERLSTTLAFSYTHPLVLQHIAQAKWELLFGQFIVDGWVLWLCWVLCHSLRLSSQLPSVTEELLFLGLVVTGEFWAGQLLGQCSQQQKQCVTHRATHFTFLNQDHIYICNAVVSLQKDCGRGYKLLYYSTRFRCISFHKKHDEDWHKTGQSFSLCMHDCCISTGWRK